MQRIIRCVALFCLCIALPNRAQAQHRGSVFYEITHTGSRDTSYLYGTLHLLEGSYVDTMPAVMHALDRAQIVLGEIVLDSQLKSQMASIAASKKSLDSLLTPAEFALADSELQHSLGMPLGFFNSYEPVAVEGALIEGYYQKRHPENVKTHIPIDMFFQQHAKKHGIEVAGLETVKEEMPIFDSLPIDSQIHELRSFIDNPDSVMNDLDTLLAAYRAGDLHKMLSAEAISSLGETLASSLLYKRNAAWLRKLPPILTSKRAFIAVGAGHLAGSYGLIAGLRKRGFRVRAIPIN